MTRHGFRATSERGFTLIELMIVVVIIGILASLAIPKFSLVSTRAREKEAEVLLKQIYTLQASYFSQEGYYAAAVPTLTVVGWSPPTSLQNYALPQISTGGGVGSTTFVACMTATGGGLENRSINEQGDFGTC